MRGGEWNVLGGRRGGGGRVMKDGKLGAGVKGGGWERVMWSK